MKRRVSACRAALASRVHWEVRWRTVVLQNIEFLMKLSTGRHDINDLCLLSNPHVHDLYTCTYKAFMPIKHGVGT